MKGRLMSAQQCADFFGIKRVTWYKWKMEDPDFPPYAIQRKNFARWEYDDIERYKEKMKERYKREGERKDDSKARPMSNTQDA